MSHRPIWHMVVWLISGGNLRLLIVAIHECGQRINKSKKFLITGMSDPLA
ncbi:MAG: hypothetical protein V4623_07095 [Pseudomonadota bacterium]